MSQNLDVVLVQVAQVQLVHQPVALVQALVHHPVQQVLHHVHQLLKRVVQLLDGVSDLPQIAAHHEGLFIFSFLIRLILRGARSRSPRRAPQPKSEKITVSSSRRSPSPAARRRQASPPRHRSRSPVRRSPPRRERERPAASPLRERRERTPEPQPKRVCARYVY